MNRRLVALTCSVSTVLALVVVGAAGSAHASNSPGRPISWLAAGDSYSSGEGLPHAGGGCEQADGINSRTYAQEAYDHLGSTGAMRFSGPLDFVACSGGFTTEFLQQQGTNPPQWTAGQSDLVTFSFGGDDVGFKQVLEQCVGFIQATVPPGEYGVNPWLPTDPGHFCPRDSILRQRIENTLGGNKYQGFLTEVAKGAVTLGGNIVVLGYPEIIEDPNQWTGLPQFFDLCQGINRTDALELRGLAGDLNATIGYAVQQVNAQHPHGVHLTFIDVNSGGSAGISGSDPRLFEPSSGQRHDLCGAAKSWMNGFTTIDGGSGSFHPKQEAQDAEASLLQQVITSQLTWNLPQAPSHNPGPSAPSSPLSLSITGSCTSDGGTLTSSSAAFTPGGTYTVAAAYPSGRSYNLGNGSSGTVRGDGSIIWNWPCQGDPSGTYTTTVTDSSTGRSVGPVSFTIDPPARPTSSAPPVTHPPTSSALPPPHPPTSTPPGGGQPVVAYNNYGTVTAPGVPMCRGNPGRPESIPGGTVSQSFTVESGISQLTNAEVQIDPDASVTATATLSVNGAVRATAATAAAGDTHFTFPPVAVQAGAMAALTITFTATLGKIITVYYTGNPGGTFAVQNSCSDGAPTFSRTDTGLRAVVNGLS